MVELLLELGAQCSCPSKGLGETPLHLAASNGHTDIIELLVQHCSPDVRNVWGGTPLHCAASRGHVDAVEKLLTLGANPASRTNKHETALHMARSADVIEYLLEKGLDVNALDANNDTALHKTVKKRDLRSCMVLLANNANAVRPYVYAYMYTCLI